MSEYVDDGLEWWEMPKPSPERLEQLRRIEEERKADTRAYLRAEGEFRRTKKALVAERGAVCQHCGTPASRLHAHHIVHRAKGGTNDPGNLVLLCVNCHQLEHRHGVGA